MIPIEPLLFLIYSLYFGVNISFRKNVNAFEISFMFFIDLSSIYSMAAASIKSVKEGLYL